MWKREPAKPEQLAPVETAKPVDTTERVTVTGRVLRKTPHLSNSYTYYHVAILVKPSDDADERVIQKNSSGGTPAYGLCEVGDTLSVNLARTKPESDWQMESFIILYDIEREKAKLEKLT